MGGYRGYLGKSIRYLLLLMCLGVCLAAGAIYFSPRPDLLDGATFGKVVLDRHGRLLRMTLSEDQKYRLRVDLDKISPHVVNSVLSYEDRYFYLHPGVNPLAILRACLSRLGGGRIMGASTISMQVARLRYDLKTDTVAGKLVQIWKALQLERHYGKSEILEAYFNLAPYGGNVEGLEAAARIYFDQGASQLTELECQALAVVPQNPAARNPVSGKDFEAARKRIWKIMGHAGEPGPLRVRSLAKIPFLAPHLASQLAALPIEDQVVSSLDLDKQRLLEKIVKGYMARAGNYGLKNAAAMLVDARNLEITALLGSTSFFDDSIQGQIDGTLARRSPGSTLKPFIYALALDQGLIHPMSILPDSPRSFGGYDPQNFERDFQGPVSASHALRHSRNLPAITLAEQLRYPGLYGFLRQAEVNFPHGPEYYGLALALGGAEISMRQIASLYAMLLNGGLWQPLKNVVDMDWQPPRRLLSPEAAFLALQMLTRPDSYLESFGQKIPLVYKTGTSNGFRDAWTCGIVGRYVLAVWVGNFDNSSHPLLVGAKTALPLYEEIAAALAGNYRLEDMVSLPAAGVNVAQTEVCLTTGDFDLEHCPMKGESWIIPGVSPVQSRHILRKVLIDADSGLRACQAEQGKTKEVWYEFWPSDLAAIFASAGVHKPKPPAWSPQCSQYAGLGPGKAPRIIFPKKNVSYKKLDGESIFQLPLQAAGEADMRKIFWYGDKQYLGASAPGETIFWKNPKLGTTIIQAVDELGRSASQKCHIEIAQ